MRKKMISDAITNISTEYIEKAADYSPKRNSRNSVWLKWGVIAACLCLVVGLTIPTVLNTINSQSDSAGTLMGDTEIYPTVMVGEQLYEWRKGAAICDGLPNNSVYYGELTHIDGQTPTKDCEFVSAFSVSGQIYTIAEDNSCVYLCVTTDWLNETVVVFDLVAETEMQSK